jgi:hypothetical protein
MVSITGGCLCGAVRYTASAEPITSRACWCRVCQYFAAGNATLNVMFRSQAVTIEGDLTDFSSLAESGNRMHRRFCPTCGVHLFSAGEARPDLIIVRTGTLDDPGSITPVASIWTKQAPSWACIDQRLPMFEGPPPPMA